MSGENDMSYLIRRAHKTHMSIKSHSRFGMHGKRTYQVRLPQVSYSIRHTQKMVFLTNESANKAEIDILSARDTTRPGP